MREIVSDMEELCPHTVLRCACFASFRWLLLRRSTRRCRRSGRRRRVCTTSRWRRPTCSCHSSGRSRGSRRRPQRKCRLHPTTCSVALVCVHVLAFMAHPNFSFFHAYAFLLRSARVLERQSMHVAGHNFNSCSHMHAATVLCAAALRILFDFFTTLASIILFQIKPFFLLTTGAAAVVV
jgi:hypothetical protein